MWVVAPKDRWSDKHRVWLREGWNVTEWSVHEPHVSEGNTQRIGESIGVSSTHVVWMCGAITAKRKTPLFYRHKREALEELPVWASMIGRDGEVETWG